MSDDTEWLQSAANDHRKYAAQNQQSNHNAWQHHMAAANHYESAAASPADSDAREYHQSKAEQYADSAEDYERQPKQ